eukprot:snap_masked-scaffold_33-processed-gene-2.48-mRNA-1 protein AED:1.00 eAED:1.00 QI:0/-1/0/0/-1/1/1/0/334
MNLNETGVTREDLLHHKLKHDQLVPVLSNYNCFSDQIIAGSLENFNEELFLVSSADREISLNSVSLNKTRSTKKISQQVIDFSWYTDPGIFSCAQKRKVSVFDTENLGSVLDFEFLSPLSRILQQGTLIYAANRDRKVALCDIQSGSNISQLNLPTNFNSVTEIFGIGDHQMFCLEEYGNSCVLDKRKTGKSALLKNFNLLTTNSKLRQGFLFKSINKFDLFFSVFSGDLYKCAFSDDLRFDKQTVKLSAKVHGGVFTMFSQDSILGSVSIRINEDNIVGLKERLFFEELNSDKNRKYIDTQHLLKVKNLLISVNNNQLISLGEEGLILKYGFS